MSFLPSSRALFAALALVAVAGPAWAVQSQQPGAACVRDTGGTFDVDSYGHAENTSSSSTLYLVCPIPTNDPSSASIPSSSDIWVTDLHYTSDVCCSQRRMNPIGGLSASSSVCSTGSSSSYQALNTTPPSANGTWDVRFEYCSVPASYSGNVSEVRSYRY